MTPADTDRVFGRGRLKMVTGEHVEVFREAALPGERRRYTKRFLSTTEGDFRHWTEREWRILARLVGHRIGPVPDVVQFDRGDSSRPALVQTYDAGVTVDHWATLLPVERDGQVLRHVFEDCAHWWALAQHALTALDAIHELQLVHLDLKPDNVCIPLGPIDFDPHEPDQVLQPLFGQIALIDFAFSLVSGENLATALPIGQQPDYDYQSPRLLRALEAGRRGDLLPTRQLDWRCDVFSVAAMLSRYLPAPGTGERGHWTPARFEQAQALVGRLFDAHHAALPPKRPHKQWIAAAERVLHDPALAASLAQGWRLSSHPSFAPVETPTPITRIAAPVAALPPLDEVEAAPFLPPAPQRSSRVRNLLWASGVLAFGAISVPLIGEAWLAQRDGGERVAAVDAAASAVAPTVEIALAPAPVAADVAAPAPAASVPSVPATVAAAASDVAVAPEPAASAPAASATPPAPAASEPAAVTAPTPPARVAATKPAAKPSASRKAQRTARAAASKAVAAAPAATKAAAATPAVPKAAAVAAAPATPKWTKLPVRIPGPADAPIVLARSQPTPAPQPAVAPAPTPAPAPPPVMPALIPAPTPAPPPLQVADDAGPAARLPDDFVERAEELLNRHLPRIAQRAERRVLRVLHMAGQADSSWQSGAVVDATRSLRLPSDEVLAGAKIASGDARRLSDAASAAFWNNHNPQRALSLQLRAFGANPEDREVVGNLAFYFLKQRPAQPEAARQLLLHALTLPDASGSRSDDWTSFAIASALTGHARDANNAWFVTLALSQGVDRPCRAALAAYASHGERLRESTEAMLARISAWGRSQESTFCRWPPSWSARMRSP